MATDHPSLDLSLFQFLVNFAITHDGLAYPSHFFMGEKHTKIGKLFYQVVMAFH
jgi:hypothetical protein